MSKGLNVVTGGKGYVGFALVKELDTAGSKGILSKNAVSRKKSRMMKLYNVTFAAEK